MTNTNRRKVNGWEGDPFEYTPYGLIAAFILVSAVAGIYGGINDMNENGAFYRKSYFNPALEQKAATSLGRKVQGFLEDYHLAVPSPFPDLSKR